MRYNAARKGSRVIISEMHVDGNKREISHTVIAEMSPLTASWLASQLTEICKQLSKEGYEAKQMGRKDNGIK